jgi:hypothetical protein
MALARLVACGVLRDSVLFLLIKDAYQSGPASRNLEMISNSILKCEFSEFVGG